jgi:hypothetical protein
VSGQGLVYNFESAQYGSYKVSVRERVWVLNGSGLNGSLEGLSVAVPTLAQDRTVRRRVCQTAAVMLLGWPRATPRSKAFACCQLTGCCIISNSF